MPVKAGEIEQLLRVAFPDAEMQISDLGGDGDHYAAILVSSQFAGKTRVQQHQMVYRALQGKMGEELHALALQTSAPQEPRQETAGKTEQPQRVAAHQNES